MGVTGASIVNTAREGEGRGRTFLSLDFEAYTTVIPPRIANAQPRKSFFLNGCFPTLDQYLYAPHRHKWHSPLPELMAQTHNSRPVLPISLPLALFVQIVTHESCSTQRCDQTSRSERVAYEIPQFSEVQDHKTSPPEGRAEVRFVKSWSSFAGEGGDGGQAGTA